MQRAIDHPPRSRLGFAFDRPAGPPSWVWVAVTTLLALLVRGIGAGEQAFWTDEVESAKLLWHPEADPLYILTRNFHGPLHKLLLFGWASVFGSGDLALRWLSVALGTATVPILYLTGRLWVGEAAARWATILLAVNPFHIYYSQEVRGYILLILLAPVAMHVFLREVEKRTFRSWGAFVLASIAVGLSSFSGLMLTATQGALALLAAWRRGYPIARFLVAMVVVVVCLLPYFREFGTVVDVDAIRGLGEVTESNQLRGDHTFDVLAPGHSLYAFSVGLTIGPSINEMHESLSFDTFKRHIPIMVAAALVFGVTAIIGFFRSRRRPEFTGFLMAWLWGPIALTALLAVLNLKVYNIRYPAASVIAWVLLLAIGLAGLRPQWLRLLLAGVLVGVSGVSVVNYHNETRFWRPDARAAAELIAREGRPNDRILLYTTPEPFIYYYEWKRNGPVDVARLTVWELRNRERFERFLDDTVACGGRLWLVRYRSWYIDPSEFCKSLLDERLTHIATWRFPELPVDLYWCEDPASVGESPQAADQR